MSDPFDDFPKGRRGKDDLPFGGDFNDFIKYIQKMLENYLDSDITSEFEKMFTNSDKPFVWGFSFNRGFDGKPRFEKFGNFPTDKQSQSSDEPGLREPLTDVIEETDTIRVITELPGVDKKDIDLKATKTKMILKATGENKRFYKKTLRFPSSVHPDSSKAKFKNGVLEIVFKKQINLSSSH